MKSINIHEAKTRLSALLAKVKSDGESFLICRYGRPIGGLRSALRNSGWDPLLIHPELSGTILYDLTGAADENEWPEKCW